MKFQYFLLVIFICMTVESVNGSSVKFTLYIGDDGSSDDVIITLWQESPITFQPVGDSSFDDFSVHDYTMEISSADDHLNEILVQKPGTGGLTIARIDIQNLDSGRYWFFFPGCQLDSPADPDSEECNEVRIRPMQSGNTISQVRTSLSHLLKVDEKITGITVLEGYQNTSDAVECAMLCLETPYCNVYHFIKNTGVCQVNLDKYGIKEGNFASSPGTYVYQPGKFKPA